MAATLLQWNARGLRCNKRDLDILIGEHQPDVICLQETKLEHSPPLSHYRCANYDGYRKSQRRHPDQLLCGVLIYIKKGLYHKVVQIDSHLQEIAVQVILGDTPITLLSVYISGNNHLTTRDVSNLIRNIRGQILITRDINEHNYMWGSLDVDTQGEIIEWFTDKTQSVYSQWRNPHLSETSSPACEQASVSDRSDHLHSKTCFEKRVGGPARYPWHWPLSHTDFNGTISGRDTTKLWSFPLFFFSNANWEQFHDMCLDSIS